MEYGSYKDLNGMTLDYGDEVNFLVRGKTITYKVMNTYLAEKLWDDNIKIFQELCVNKNDLAKKCYRYESYSGEFPECNDEDYEALTRITLALLKLCDNYSNNWKERMCD